MKIPRRVVIGMIGAAALGRRAMAADKIVGGTVPRDAVNPHAWDSGSQRK